MVLFDRQHRTGRIKSIRDEIVGRYQHAQSNPMSSFSDFTAKAELGGPIANLGTSQVRR